MMNRARLPLLFLSLALTLAPLTAAKAAAPELSPSESLEAWLPEDAGAYARIIGLGERLQTFLDSDLRKELESLALVRQAMTAEPWQKFQTEVQGFKEATGKEALKVFQDLFGREVVVGMRTGSGIEAVLLSRTAGKTELEAGLQALRDLAFKRLGFVPTPQESTYKAVKIENYDKLFLAKLGNVLALSSSPGYMQRVIDLATKESKASVREAPAFKKAIEGAGKAPLLAIYARPQSIPNFKLPEKADNPLGSLLGSGWLGALQQSELLTAILRIEKGDAGLEISSFLGEAGLPEKYKSFFPEVADDSLAMRLEKRGVLGMMQVHRNLAQWWEKREDLMPSSAAGELIQFAQVMSIVFQGRNFQDEVLPEFGPTITLVARNQEYKDLPESPKPAIPGFAAIFELKSADEFGNSLTAGFQTLIGIINADRAQKKQEGGMAMLLKTEKVGDVDLQTVAITRRKGEKPSIAWNFTPSLAIVGSRVVISSCHELGRILVEEISKSPTTAAKPRRVGDSIVVDAAMADAILRQNFDLLVADSMVKKGVGKEQAEAELKAGLEILKKLLGLRVDSTLEGKQAKLTIGLKTKLGDAPTIKSAGKPAEKEAKF